MVMRSSEQVRRKVSGDTITKLLAEAEAAGGSPEFLSLLRQVYSAARRQDTATQARLHDKIHELSLRPGSLRVK